MALNLNFDTCVINNCNSIKFTETTGVYSVSNTGGYGAPNITLGSVLTAVLEVTDPGDVVTNLNLFTHGLPSSNLSFSYSFDAIDLGLNNIIDGKWKFKYTITTASATYTLTKNVLFYCNMKCCVTQTLSDLVLTDCTDCNNSNKDYDNYIKLSTFFDSLKKAAECGSVSEFTKIKKIIDKLCKNKDCKTCK